MKKYKLNIPAALQQRNLTRRALAKRMKVTEPSVTSYIQGNPTIDKIYAIAEALECSVLDLFFPEESAPTPSDPATSSPATSDPLAGIDFSDTTTPPTAPTPPTSPTPTYTPLHSPTPIVTLPVPVLVTMPPITCPHCNGVIVLTPDYISTAPPKDSEE